MKEEGPERMLRAFFFHIGFVILNEVKNLGRNCYGTARPRFFTSFRMTNLLRFAEEQPLRYIAPHAQQVDSPRGMAAERVTQGDDRRAAPFDPLA